MKYWLECVLVSKQERIREYSPVFSLVWLDQLFGVSHQDKPTQTATIDTVRRFVYVSCCVHADNPLQAAEIFLRNWHKLQLEVEREACVSPVHENKLCALMPEHLPRPYPPSSSIYELEVEL